MLSTRRAFLGGLGVVVAAPAVIRVAQLMPIKVYKEPVGTLITGPLFPLYEKTMVLERIIPPMGHESRIGDYYGMVSEVGAVVEHQHVTMSLDRHMVETLVVKALWGDEQQKAFNAAAMKGHTGETVTVNGKEYVVKELSIEAHPLKIETLNGPYYDTGHSASHFTFKT